MHRKDTITLAGAVICLLLFLTGCVTVLAPPQGLPGESGEEQWEAKTYEVGQEGPAGGIIVYRNPDGDSSWEYIEVAPAGWAGTDTDPSYQWGARKHKVGELKEDLGSGAENTERIVQVVGEYESGMFAALACGQAVIGGYDDWYLPSDQELLLLYENLHLKGLGSFLLDDSYYSSTEGTSLNAHILNFQKGQIKSSSKSSPKYVRPVRRF